MNPPTLDKLTTALSQTHDTTLSGPDHRAHPLRLTPGIQRSIRLRHTRTPPPRTARTDQAAATSAAQANARAQKPPPRTRYEPDAPPGQRQRSPSPHSHQPLTDATSSRYPIRAASPPPTPSPPHAAPENSNRHHDPVRQSPQDSHLHIMPRGWPRPFPTR